MKRRSILRYLGASAAAAVWPAAAQPQIPLVVFFGQTDEKSLASFADAFRRGMRERGYVEGRDVNIEVLTSAYSVERAEVLAGQIIAKRPAVVVLQGGASRTMPRLTKTIPLVAGFSGDIISAGLVESLARPGGNVTGMQFMSLELVGKRIELLKEIVPRLARVAVISDIAHPGEEREREASQAAADRLGIRVKHYPVTKPAELDTALEAARASGTQALVFFPDSISFGQRERIAAFALKHGLPTVSGWDAYAEAGFLLIYGTSLRAAWARTAYFVDRILKGAKPAEMPAEQATKFELVINMKTAKAIGLVVPKELLLRADRVIE